MIIDYSASKAAVQAYFHGPQRGKYFIQTLKTIPHSLLSHLTILRLYLKKKS